MRAAVVLTQQRHDLVQRHQPSCGNDSGLSHPATEHFANSARLGDGVCGAHEDRSHRCAKTLGKAEHDRVTTGAQLGSRDVERRRRVVDAGAIEVDGKAVVASDPNQFGHSLARRHATTGEVMTILEHNQRGRRAVAGPRLNRRLHLCRRKNAVRRFNGAWEGA